MQRPARLIALAIVSLSCAASAAAQQAAPRGCVETPRQNALPPLCTPPASKTGAAAGATGVRVALKVPIGTPLRIAIDKRVRITHAGEAIHGRVVESVYALDQPVIPAGSTVSGHIVKIEPVPAKARIFSYSDGDFSPFRKYQVTFNTLVLPDGKRSAIHTTVSPGIAEPVHLVTYQPRKAKTARSGALRHAVSNAKKEAKSKLDETLGEIKSPHIPQRLKTFVLAQLPYRRQYIMPGTQFTAALDDSLNFGWTARTQEQLSHLGGQPAQDSLLHARLVSAVSSASSKRGAPVIAVLTEPVFSPDHHLLLPANSRLVGTVLQAVPARRFHRNGELRIAFNRIETPKGAGQSMLGTLEGVEVARSANLKLDEEGGARTTNRKTRYLSTGLTLLMAAAASRPDVEHGTTNAAGDSWGRAGVGTFGSRLTGCLIALAARSQPVSMAFGAYSASTSLYSNFLSRGKDVVFAKNTPLEIDFGFPDPAHRRPAPIKR